jgi:hypothetical protein
MSKLMSIFFADLIFSFRRTKNFDVVPFGEDIAHDSFDKELLLKYKVSVDDITKYHLPNEQLDRFNYRSRMHNLLYLEELKQEKILST